MAWPFLEPVNADEVPEYYDVITDPIGKALPHATTNQNKRVFFFFLPIRTDQSRDLVYARFPAIGTA